MLLYDTLIVLKCFKGFIFVHLILCSYEYNMHVEGLLSVKCCVKLLFRLGTMFAAPRFHPHFGFYLSEETGHAKGTQYG